MTEESKPQSLGGRCYDLLEELKHCATWEAKQFAIEQFVGAERRAERERCAVESCDHCRAGCAITDGWHFHDQPCKGNRIRALPDIEAKR
jgi:hypothetical protein